MFEQKLNELYDSMHTVSWCINKLYLEFPEVGYNKVVEKVNAKFDKEGRKWPR